LATEAQTTYALPPVPRPLEDGWTLPASWYAEPAVLDLERDRIFASAWQYAGPAEHIAEAGSFFASVAGHIPVVVTRAADRELRGFVNVCRHRGHVVAEGTGCRATLQCPYHAWTYELDGRLRKAPRSEREPGFDASVLSLLPVSVDTWGPFVFVNPDPEAEPLLDALGALPDIVARSGLDLDGLRFHSHVPWEQEVNWKVALENYLECYHCPVAHPGFSAVMDVSPDAYLLETSRWRAAQYSPPRPEPRGSYDPSGEVERGQFHFLFPNTVVNVMPGRPNLSIGPIVPLTPERTYRFLDYLVAPDASEAWLEEMVAFDAQVGAEDRHLVERVQAGVRSGVLEEGRLLPESERLVEHFQSLVVDALA
jgi:choline monooxygenase